MGFDRYLTNKHCHRNSAFDSVQHKKASKERKKPFKARGQNFLHGKGIPAGDQWGKRQHACKSNESSIRI